MTAAGDAHHRPPLRSQWTALGLMDTFFRGKVVRIMPKKYDVEFKAQPVRSFTDHAEDSDTSRPASRRLAGGREARNAKL